MKYQLWEMDVKGDARLQAECPYIMRMLKDIVPERQRLSPACKFLYIVAWDQRKGSFRYPWNWASGRQLPKGDLRHSVRRMLRARYSRRPI